MPGPLRYWEDYEVGADYALGRRTVSEAEIIGFATQFDPQFFHVDPEAAKRSMFGGLIASGWHTCSIMMRMLVDNYLNPETSLGSPGVDGIRWLKPVRPGDTLTGTMRILEKRESRSKPDIGIVINEASLQNQQGEVVATIRATNLIRRRAGAA
ncbi:MaoC family dehydratase [Vineibacter terrae]|uniref:MaoC family dehydratase n=1 Tax=Vineibacter terrae TaxID=2586908 RepID=A0A5C8PB49_9HYPH|nr:MaoC family dehydratase [Vineibacter terrae]TXL70786.1 MaoC family dehydratase [Vineibacter terrae]